jgi:hypothetical protein
VVRHRQAAAGELRTVPGHVEVGLLDAHVLPGDVELLGDQHGEEHFDRLPDLGVLGHDRHDAVGCDADEGAWRERGQIGRRLGACPGLVVEAEHHPAPRDGGDAQERAAVDLSELHHALFDFIEAAFLIASRMRR